MENEEKEEKEGRVKGGRKCTDFKQFFFLNKEERKTRHKSCLALMKFDH